MWWTVLGNASVIVFAIMCLLLVVMEITDHLKKKGE